MLEYVYVFSGGCSLSYRDAEYPLYEGYLEAIRFFLRHDNKCHGSKMSVIEVLLPDDVIFDAQVAGATDVLQYLCTSEFGSAVVEMLSAYSRADLRLLSFLAEHYAHILNEEVLNQFMLLLMEVHLTFCVTGVTLHNMSYADVIADLLVEQGLLSQVS